MQNQIYRGVKHDAKTQENNHSNSNRTYRGVSFKQANSVSNTEQDAQMSYRGSAYTKAV